MLAVAFIGAVTGAAVNGFIALVTGEDINGIAAALVSGAVSGAITSVGMVFALATGGWGGLVIAAFVGGISSASGKLMNHGMKNDWNYDDLDFSSVIWSGVIGAGTGAITYGIMLGVANLNADGLSYAIDKTSRWATKVAEGFRFGLEDVVMSITLLPMLETMNSVPQQF